MIRRFVLRVFLVGFLLSFLVASSVGVACYLAVSTPSYYAALLAKHGGGDEADAAEQRFEAIGADIKQWQMQSLMQQHAQAYGDAHLQGVDFEPDPDYDPAKDVYTVRVGQDDLNALLASDDFRISGGQLTNPRVDLRDGRVVFGCSIATPLGRLVLSTNFAPSTPEDDTLRLRLVSAHVGRLPLPLTWLSQWLPKQQHRLQGTLSLDTTGPTPELVLQLPSDGKKSPLAQSIECVRGYTVVQLTPAAPAPR